MIRTNAMNIPCSTRFHAAPLKTAVAAALCVLASLPGRAVGQTGQPMIAYSRDNSNSPRFRTWNGSSWSNYTSMPSVGAEPVWVILRYCPVRAEFAFGCLDAGNDINIEIYSGSSFGTSVEVTADAAVSTDRPYDLGYEQSSGDLLVVYWDNTVNKVGYRTSGGSASLSSAAHLTLPATDNVHYMTLYPRPKTNDIILIAVNELNDLYAAVWDGSSWGSVSTLETSTSTYTEECYAVEYEQVTNRALLVYCESGVSTPRYRTWSGSSWSSESSLPSTGAAPRWIRLAAKPNSNDIAMGAYDAGQDINANVWNGSSWGTNFEAERYSGNSSRRQFDIAYEPSGARALLVYAERYSSRCRYRTWNGSSWSSEKTGPSLGNSPRVIAVVTGDSGSELFVVVSDTGTDLTVTRWDGSSLYSSVQLESTLGGYSSSEQFMMTAPPTTRKTITKWREVPN